MIARRTSQFKKDVKRALRRGKDPEKLKQVMENLLEGKPLSPRFKDHSLKGAYSGHRECHLEPDWLLIYLPTDDAILFERTGSHADLFE